MANVPWAEVCEKFQAALALSRVELHKNPEKEPYKSKYSARAMLEEVKALLGPAPEDEDERPEADDGPGADDHALGLPAEVVEPEGPVGQRAVRLAVIEFHLGVNHIDTEELSAGEEHLVKCLRLLRRYRLSHDCISLCIQAQISHCRPQAPCSPLSPTLTSLAAASLSCGDAFGVGDPPALSCVFLSTTPTPIHSIKKIRKQVINEDVSKLRNKLYRRYALVQKHLTKLRHWQQVLEDMCSTKSQPTSVSHEENSVFAGFQSWILRLIKSLEKNYAIDTLCEARRPKELCSSGNNLGILWSEREEIETAQAYLESSEALYNQYMKEVCYIVCLYPSTYFPLFIMSWSLELIDSSDFFVGSPPLDPTECFLPAEEKFTEQERSKRFEKVYTHNLYYLAQVYQHLEMFEKAAHYCHSTLKRQLEHNAYHPIEWAINAATLSQFYINKLLKSHIYQPPRGHKALTVLAVVAHRDYALWRPGTVYQLLMSFLVKLERSQPQKTLLKLKEKCQSFIIKERGK
ncbi:hypothetical protein P7K49_023991 [Saguinus oedipus]|uniref:KIF-binding protein n=1 Tax=Saguinus oedipus TaxID=9490 RepID=A0ABQ9UNA3_SAGOE|nr:hypothetical protein P7K49_023991 [Saguinus oedipus]